MPGVRMARTTDWHVIEARSAFVGGLSSTTFATDLQAFAVESPPAAFEFERATADGYYAAALIEFARDHGLAAGWFQRYCHDLVWADMHDSPRRLPSAPRPLPLGGLFLHLAFRPSDQPPLPPLPQAERQFTWAWALWDRDTQAELRRRVVKAFDEFWANVVEPTRQAQAAPTRYRPLATAQRDARAYVARSLVGRTPPGGAVAATISRMDELWPGQGYLDLDDDVVSKALMNFGRLLRAPLPGEVKPQT
jgi:hypothetical protein